MRLKIFSYQGIGLRVKTRTARAENAIREHMTPYCSQYLHPSIQPSSIAPSIHTYIQTDLRTSGVVVLDYVRGGPKPLLSQQMGQANETWEIPKMVLGLGV